MTRPQLMALGVDRCSIDHRLKTGRLHRVHRGVYAVGRPPIGPLERAMAAVLACGSGALLSHGSAMTLWRFWKRWDQPFEVSIRGDRRPRGIIVHRPSSLHRRDIDRQHGIPVTHPARTLLDIAPRLSEQTLARAINDALLSPYLNHGELAERIAQLPHHPGAAAIRRLIQEPGNPTRSHFEDSFPAFCRRHGLPPPIMNATVCGYEVDALFPDQKLIVELDSWSYHSTRRSFEGDRSKDADTLAAGYGTVRITWERYHAQPDREAERLHEILASRHRSSKEEPGARPGSSPSR